MQKLSFHLTLRPGAACVLLSRDLTPTTAPGLIRSFSSCRSAIRMRRAAARGESDLYVRHDWVGRWDVGRSAVGDQVLRRTAGPDGCGGDGDGQIAAPPP